MHGLFLFAKKTVSFMKGVMFNVLFCKNIGTNTRK